jgi:hypothetical protein
MFIPYMITIKYKLITLNPLYMQIYYGVFNFAHHVDFYDSLWLNTIVL